MVRQNLWRRSTRLLRATGPRVRKVCPQVHTQGFGKAASSQYPARLQMTIRIAEGTANAEIFLTGGEISSANLDGSARKTGENIWTIELRSKKPKLIVRGIFRGHTFVR